jgi:glutamyl-tRNA synthetase
MCVSGCLFDTAKLNDVSKNVLSRLTAEEIYTLLAVWTETYDAEFHALLTANPDYAKKILAIGRGGKKPRKDFAVYTDVRPYMAFFYDALFARKDAMPNTFAKEDIASALQAFLASYDPSDDMNTWFSKIKEIAQSLGFAPETKLYKQNPQDYKGHVGDVSAFIRIALTGQVNSPDLYTVMQILGTKRVNARIADAIALL